MMVAVAVSANEGSLIAIVGQVAEAIAVEGPEAAALVKTSALHHAMFAAVDQEVLPIVVVAH